MKFGRTFEIMRIHRWMNPTGYKMSFDSLSIHHHVKIAREK